MRDEMLKDLADLLYAIGLFMEKYNITEEELDEACEEEEEDPVLCDFEDMEF